MSSSPSSPTWLKSPIIGAPGELGAMGTHPPGTRISRPAAFTVQLLDQQCQHHRLSENLGRGVRSGDLCLPSLRVILWESWRTTAPAR